MILTILKRYIRVILSYTFYSKIEET